MPHSAISAWLGPTFGLLFHNATTSDIVLALKINHDWWLTPIIRSQTNTHVLDIQEGATVEWRGISSRACWLHNVDQQTHHRIDDPESFQCDDLVEWQGQTVVSFGMLGCTAHITLS